LRRRHRKTRKQKQPEDLSGRGWRPQFSLVVPWTLYLTVPAGTVPEPLSPAVLWKALWPVLLGAVLAIVLWRWWRSLPRIPKGDIIVALDGGMQMAVTWGKALGRMDGVLRQWPAAGVSLLMVTIALGAAVLAR